VSGVRARQDGALHGAFRERAVTGRRVHINDTEPPATHLRAGSFKDMVTARAKNQVADLTERGKF
jgi:hypothetical protein